MGQGASNVPTQRMTLKFQLPEQFYDAYALSKGAAAGGHNPHQHRWSDLLYEVVPDFRVCTFILSNPSYLQTDRLNFLAV